jgi:hypothetical protein
MPDIISVEGYCPDNEKARELISQVELDRARYFHGFGNASYKVFLNCAAMWKNDDKGEINFCKEVVFRNLKKIEEPYQDNHLLENGTPDQAPLAAIKYLLPFYHRLVYSFLQEPRKDLVNELGEVNCKLHDQGELYRQYISERLEQIRQIPGYEEFYIRLISDKNEEYFM